MGSRFFVPDQTGKGSHPESYTMGTRSFLRVKRLKNDVKFPPHLASTLKKVCSYTVTLFFTYMAVLYLCFISVSVLAELLALVLLRLQVNKYLFELSLSLLLLFHLRLGLQMGMSKKFPSEYFIWTSRANQNFYIPLLIFGEHKLSSPLCRFLESLFLCRPNL